MKLIQRVIYRIGRYSRLVRTIYFKGTGHWLWGIVGYIRDNPVKESDIIY